MAQWNEADHPRDDIGRFTYKGGSSSYSSSGRETYEEKMQRRADTLYPTMQDKKSNDNQIDYSNIGLGNYNGILTGGAAEINNSLNNINYNELRNYARNENDRNFFIALDVVFGSEGKYVNHPNDKGGPTNLGVTQATYNDYCRRHKLPVKNVKNLSKNEVIQVYYNDYWVKFGLDKEKDPIKSLILFDTAVLHGVGKAKDFYKKSNGDLDKILELRREHYKNTVDKEPKQKSFEKGWYNRINKLQGILNRYEEVKKYNY